MPNSDNDIGLDMGSDGGPIDGPCVALERRVAELERDRERLSNLIAAIVAFIPQLRWGESTIKTNAAHPISRMFDRWLERKDTP